MENKENFHQIMGGRIPRDKRYEDKESAQKIREHLVELKKTGRNMGNVADILNISSSTLSLAAYGRAGDIPQPEFDNLSSTEYILKRLSDMVENQD